MSICQQYKTLINRKVCTHTHLSLIGRLEGWIMFQYGEGEVEEPYECVVLYCLVSPLCVPARGNAPRYVSYQHVQVQRTTFLRDGKYQTIDNYSQRLCRTNDLSKKTLTK